jgi:hypothetical protein
MYLNRNLINIRNKIMKHMIKLLILVLAFGSLKAAELVNLEIENRQVSGNDYLADVYANVDGTWTVGSCTIIINYNSDGLTANDYDGDDLLNFDSGLSGAGYSCTQGAYDVGQVSIDLFILNPSVDKTSRFKIGTIKLKILDNTEFDDFSFNAGESEVYNNSTALTHGCSLSSCWTGTSPSSQVIGEEASLSAPSLSSPSNGATDVSTSPSLSWGSVDDATSYDVQVSTSNDFSTLEVDDNVTSTSKSLSGLDNETTYLWRVRAKNSGETSDWSSVWTFETEASGGGGGNGELVNLEIENRQVSGNDYLADVYANLDGTWTVGSCTIIINYNSDGLSANDYDGDDLLNFDSGLSGAGYSCTQGAYDVGQVSIDLFILNPSVDKTSRFKIGTIKLKILDNTEFDDFSFNAGESEVYNNSTALTHGCSLSSCWTGTSPTSKVIGEEASLSAPNLSSPANSSTDISTSPTLSWTSVSEATSYDIQVSTVNDFSTLEVDDNVTSTSKSLSGLNNETTYLWRVRAKNSSETSDWSSVWTFETEADDGGLHFTFTTTNKLMTLKVPEDADLLLDGVQISTGDEIGVFTQDYVCVGAVEWEGTQVFFNVYGATSTPPVDGLQEGEEMIYKFWDASANEEFEVSEVGHSDFMGGAINGEFDSSVPYKVIDSLIAVSSFTQTLNFNTGWNLFSSYIVAPDPDLDEVMAGVSSDLIIMRNDNSGIFVPNNFNTIGDWNNHDGYEGYFTSSTTIDIEGTKLTPEEEDISLGTGWSFIGYLRDSDMNIESALTTINTNLVIARDGGSGIYVPGGFNTIGDMETGMGYQVFLSTSDILTYPANGSGKLGDYSHQITDVPEYLRLKEIGTGISLILFIEELQLPNGIEIGAFSKDEELFGSGIVYNEQTVLVIHGDNEMTEYRDGFSYNEEILIKAFDPENNQFTELNMADIRTINNIELNKLKFSDKSIVYAKEGNSGETYFAANRLNISPNPVNEEAKMSLSLKENTTVTIEIYSTSGQKLHTINNGIMSRGIHEMQLDFADYLSGMYTIMVKLDNEVLSTNVVKVK